MSLMMVRTSFTEAQIDLVTINRLQIHYYQSKGKILEK